VAAVGATITTTLDGAVIDVTQDATFDTGRVGFYTPKEKGPLFDAVRVTDGAGQMLLEDDISGGLSKWQFVRTLSFVADGATRDRLVWSGDLYDRLPVGALRADRGHAAWRDQLRRAR
jgi:hypothetical protein